MSYLQKIILIFTLINFLIFGSSCGSHSYDDSKSTVNSSPILSQDNSAVKPNESFPNKNEQLGLERLIRRSEFIVFAKIIKVSSDYERYDEQASLIMSRIQLKIFEQWKGDLPSQIIIRSFGGYKDEVPFFAEIFPRFHEGEEVILFLSNFNGGIFPIEHAFGKKTIENNLIKETGENSMDFKNKIFQIMK